MYGKIFTQIFDSSIADDYNLRHFFMDLIVLADINGVVDMTPSAISSRTRIPLNQVNEMLSKLEQADPESKSKTESGVRIRKLDSHRSWGWEIVNYLHYRGIASDEQRRECTKLRTRKWRNSKHKQTSDAPVTHGDASDAMQRQRQRQKQKETNTQSVSASDPNYYEIPKPNRAIVTVDIQEFKMLIGGLMGRPEDSPWSHLEEITLVEVAKRPKCLEEFAHIQGLYSRGSRRWLPHEVLKLLEKWTGCLDRARMPADSLKTDEQRKADSKAVEMMIPKLPKHYMTDL